MPAPLVGAAAAAAARLVAKKLASNAAKKSRDKISKSTASTPKGKLMIPSNAHPKLHSKVSKNVSTKPSAEMKKSNSKFYPTSGVKQAQKENERLAKPLTKAEIKANARGLKAANKPVSKKNAGQNASKMKTDIIKNATPARANRTRLGKSALKSK
jgi:hypothetical protein